MATPEISVICYDFHAVSRFFRSVAVTIAMQKTTSLEWTTYRDSAVINGIYAVFRWATPPGTAEIRTGSVMAVEQETDKLHERFVLAWLRKLHEDGPQAANDYVKDMARLREDSKHMLAEIMRDAYRINVYDETDTEQEVGSVVSETSDTIIALGRIRLGAAVGVAAIGAAAGIAVAAGGMTVMGLAAGASSKGLALTGLGIAVTNSVIETWEDGPGAKVAAISMDGAMAGASYGGGKLAEAGVEKALASQARSQHIVRSAEGLIRQHSERLGQDGLRKAAIQKSRNILQKSTEQAARETDNIARAGQLAKDMGKVTKALPVVFAAIDVFDAWSDYQDLVREQEQFDMRLR